MLTNQKIVKCEPHEVGLLQQLPVEPEPSCLLIYAAIASRPLDTMKHGSLNWKNNEECVQHRHNVLNM